MVHERFLNSSGLAWLSASALARIFALASVSFLYASPSDGGTIGTGAGTLTVITTPERAEVWINDGYAGLTPIRDKSLAEGTYTLRLVDPVRQNSASETIVITEGERLIVERSLGGSYGKLRVDTDPQGADVAIVAELGKTPLVNDYLTPGQYRIEVRHPNAKYLPLTQDVSFADGQPVAISHKLEMPPIFTTRRLVQLGLGAGAVLGWTWAIIESRRISEGKEVASESKTRRIIAITAGASFSVALQVTIFIW